MKIKKKISLVVEQFDNSEERLKKEDLSLSVDVYSV